jgi:hypothetical protein
MPYPEPLESNHTSTEVEVEIDANDSPNVDTTVSFSATVTKIKTWYNGLAAPAQVVVAVVGVFVALSVLTAILRLVSAVFSVLILGAIVYFIYRFILKAKA